MRLPSPLLPLLALAVLLSTGCAIERTLRITSVPEGATVRLDGQEVGVTPVVIPFEYYGVRRVTLYHEGYLTNSTTVNLKAPWTARFPWDLVTETVLPIRRRDRRELHVVLTPGEDVATIPSLRSVIGRAGVLRHAGPEGPRDLPAPEPIEPAELQGGDDTP
ncbi:MAG TPA: PEGA domain-containing protein [Planctomycetes bacterium]|nr:PEGA domain-containing protein [Planctomycetota bacterium]